MPLLSRYELATARCGAADVPFDDHLGDIEVPILYLGAGGGLGTHGQHMARLTGSDDVMQHIMSAPGIPRLLDYGHADLVMAEDASDLAWNPLRDWLVAHHVRGPQQPGHSRR